MTSDELIEQIDANNRAILARFRITPNPSILDLMAKAGIYGFGVGCNTSLSMMEGDNTIKKIQSIKLP